MVERAVEDQPSHIIAIIKRATGLEVEELKTTMQDRKTRKDIAVRGQHSLYSSISHSFSTFDIPSHPSSSNRMLIWVLHSVARIRIRVVNTTRGNTLNEWVFLSVFPMNSLM